MKHPNEVNALSKANADNNEASYNKMMEEINRLQSKGEANLSNEELATLRTLALEAQAYEKTVYTIPAPTTLAGLIELRMYELKLKQRDAAKLLGLSDAKLSLILNGKQKPDVALLKAAHNNLHIDANLLLEVV
jgi:HTH-type transcriptional regulator/antitoxin HigA